MSCLVSLQLQQSYFTEEAVYLLQREPQTSLETSLCSTCFSDLIISTCVTFCLSLTTLFLLCLFSVSLKTPKTMSIGTRDGQYDGRKLPCQPVVSKALSTTSVLRTLNLPSKKQLFNFHISHVLSSFARFLRIRIFEDASWNSFILNRLGFQDADISIPSLNLRITNIRIRGIVRRKLTKKHLALKMSAQINVASDSFKELKSRF